MKFTNLLSVITYFADKQKATDYLISLRWPNGVMNCPHCSGNKIYTLKGANKRFKCATCREQFSATKGTIFENSAIPLQKWFAAIYLHTSHKKGISSHQLAKDLGITQKSAWFMLQRIRYALQSGSFVQGDNAIVEMDETFVGGKRRNMHKSKRAELSKLGEGYVAQTMVVGMLSRGVGVKATVVRDMPTQVVLHAIAREHMKPNNTLITDGHGGYKGLKHFCKHEIINHSQDEWVRGEFHTNGIEGFWSHFKRTIYGTYHQVSDKHLDKYVDECEFRFNTREISEINRFDKFLTLCNRRLTYNELIADNE